MQDLNEIYNHLTNVLGGVTHDELKCHPKDIDIYLPKHKMLEAKLYMESSGFIRTLSTQEHLIYFKFVNSKLYMFDLSSGYNYYFDLLKGFELTPKGNKYLAQNPKIGKLIKKFGSLKNLDDNEFLSIYNFIKVKNFVQINQDIPLSSVSEFSDAYINYTKKYYFYTALKKIEVLRQQLNKGRSYAFVGPDGAGKSFYISKLEKAIKVKKIYLGDWFFKLQRVYNWLLKIPSPYNRFIFILYYLENVLRRLKVAYWSFSGRMVFIDRFPGTNRSIMLTGLLGKINKLQFRIMPKPTAFFVLRADPEEIYARKQELSINEIDEIQDKLSILLHDTSHYIINTQDMDMALNKMLSIIYEN